ncbi:hypothetical protein HDU83_000912 [Entophlyctis luteolus]|nr:hypothetical protein HDU83_000912 [Entophlyctis luteolus]
MTVKTFTWADIEASAAKKLTADDVNKGGPALLVIHNKVYDIGAGTGFLAFHPGGAVAVSQLGKDASGAFEVFHTEHAEAIMSDFYVGDLDPSEVPKPNDFKTDIDKLREDFKKQGLFESNKLYYLFKVVSTFSLGAASLSLLWAFGRSSTLAVLLAGTFMAVFWQQSGWLAHDFLHHQVFKNRLYNDAVGYIVGNVWQGFSVSWWKDKVKLILSSTWSLMEMSVQHCTHHSVPNIHGEDPDINTMPFLAWSEHALEFFHDVKDADLARFFVAYQPTLFFPILGIARLAWCSSSIRFNIGEKAKLLSPLQRAVEKTTLAIHWAWLLTAAFMFATPLRALLFLLVAECGCGLLLAFVFTVNHNGMPVYTASEAKGFDFYELQIRTGRDVLPSLFNDWFTGGLNYQIEHHIFPTLPRHSFGAVSGPIEELCRKHSVPFHKTSLLGGLKEILQRLDGLSKASGKIRKID